LHDDSDKVFSKLLYASPIYKFNSKPVYSVTKLEILKTDAESQNCTHCMLHSLGDPLLTAKVHWFQVLTDKLDCMEEVLVANEDKWGSLTMLKLGAIRRLEMAIALKRISGEDQRLVDNALHLSMEVQLHGCSNLKRG